MYMIEDKFKKHKYIYYILIVYITYSKKYHVYLLYTTLTLHK